MGQDRSDHLHALAATPGGHEELLRRHGDRSTSAADLRTIEVALANTPGAGNAQALARLLVASAGNPAVARARFDLLAIAAARHPWDLLSAAWAAGDPATARCLADLAAAHARLGRDHGGDARVQAAWHHLGRQDQEADLAWLDPRLLVWADQRNVAVASGPARPATAVETDAEWIDELSCAASITTNSNGRFSAMTWQGGWPPAWPGPLSSFDAFADASALDVTPISPRTWFAELAHLAIHGGAYDHGLGPLDGIHAVWRDARRLLALPPGASSPQVAEILAACACVRYPTATRWFRHVAWDGCLGIANPVDRRATLIAWTDTD